MRPTLQLLVKQCCVAEVPPRIAIDAGACTRTGSHRTNNEDGHCVDSESHVFVVADGIGGASAGERASRMAVELLPRHLSRVLPSDYRDDEVFDAIRAAFAETNAAILAAARQDSLLHQMGTTAVTALVIGPRLYLGSIGDSRAYLVRNGRIEQLTVDHTMAQALVEAGALAPKAALRHQWRNVLSKFLGSKEPDNEPDVRVVDLQGGDQIILASDGLSDVVDEEAMMRILHDHFDAQDAAEALIHTAEQKNAPDDATCVVLFVQELNEPALPVWWSDSGGRIELRMRN